MDLKATLRKVRYLRHLYLIHRALLRSFEVRESQRHSSRLSEYKHYITPPERGITVILGVNKSKISSFMSELEGSEFLRHIHESIEQIQGIEGPMSVE